MKRQSQISFFQILFGVLALAMRAYDKTRLEMVPVIIDWCCDYLHDLGSDAHFGRYIQLVSI